jgi:hypothetical protein
MTKRLLATAALAASFLGGAPAAQACDLEHCPWSAPVCEVVDCTPYLGGCFPIDTLQLICL